VKTITVKLLEALAGWLSRYSRKLGRPQSDVVRDALHRISTDAGGASCHEAFADVCGIIEGPKDLSTNPKHLSGLGE